MKKFGMIINVQKPEAVEMGRRLLKWGGENGVKTLLPRREADAMAADAVADEEWLGEADAAIVVGGDGTFLRAARYVLGSSIPIYGINLGRLGFLASGKAEEAERDLTRILKGDYTVLERQLLRCDLLRSGETSVMYALNDFVLSKNAIARLLYIEVRFNGKFFGILPSDGIIISSPTGSTAYALSAGGPIIPPHMHGMVLAPICAHTLYSRPILAAPEDIITMVPQVDGSDVILTQDGQIAYGILPGDRVDISLSKEHTIRTINMPGRTFLDLLQEKLGWGKHLGIQPSGLWRDLEA